MCSTPELPAHESLALMVNMKAGHVISFSSHTPTHLTCETTGRSTRGPGGSTEGNTALKWLHASCTGHDGVVFILNTYITDNSSPARRLSPTSSTRIWATTELHLRTSDLTKPKMSPYDSQIRGDQVRMKTRTCTGDAFERRR